MCNSPVCRPVTPSGELPGPQPALEFLERHPTRAGVIRPLRRQAWRLRSASELRLGRPRTNANRSRHPLARYRGTSRSAAHPVILCRAGGTEPSCRVSVGVLPPPARAPSMRPCARLDQSNVRSLVQCPFADCEIGKIGRGSNGKTLQRAPGRSHSVPALLVFSSCPTRSVED